MKASAAATHTALIKEKARDLGFSQCGVAKAGFLEEEAPRLEAWLKGNMHGQMHYMANHFDKRLDPTKLVPGAKSVISFLYNYYPEQDLAQSSHYKIAKYAYGTDYHFVIKDKLRELLKYITDIIGEVEGRAFVDSAPVMERQWAQKAGLGWQGKNSLLLNKQKGSFFFLAELIIDLELEPDQALAKDFCGNCTRCIDACPTEAIVKPGVVDGSRCISYFTIELKEAIPKVVEGKFNNWVFGCDICQDVCPWNRFSTPHQEPDFKPHPDMENMKKADWEEISKEVFNKIFKKSAIKRSKYEGFVRNISFIRQAKDEEKI